MKVTEYVYSLFARKGILIMFSKVTRNEQSDLVTGYAREQQCCFVKQKQTKLQNT